MGHDLRSVSGGMPIKVCLMQYCQNNVGSTGPYLAMIYTSIQNFYVDGNLHGYRSNSMPIVSVTPGVH